jgi:hypothetical protein
VYPTLGMLQAVEIGFAAIVQLIVTIFVVSPICSAIRMFKE